MKIGMLGLGTVGGGVAKILESPSGRTPLLFKVELVQVGVRDLTKPRHNSLPPQKLTTHLEKIVTDAEIDIVVEVMGGLEPARTLILKAIENGKHVVTANKSLIAAYGSEIFASAKDKGVCIAFEAAVGGGIPIIQCLKQSLGANKIKQITGIVNGTTNYILSQMAQKGVSFDDALQDAMQKGYAEANPTADVDGIDATEKLAILALVGFGIKVDCQKIFKTGIRSISQRDIAYAKAMNYTIKLLANARLNEDDSLQLNVQPHFVENSHPLAAINDVFNAIFLEGDPVGQLMLYGQGAGEGATASAVVSDILNIVSSSASWQNIHVKSSKLASASQEMESNFYLRVVTEKIATAAGAIAWSLGDFNVPPMSVQQQITKEGVLEIAIITESVFRSTLDNAIGSIRGLPYVKEVANVLPILEAQ
ncbi:MAG TPA: homoserine dehydrogenase [Cyanobacteria bacterium UBA11369]|nr:homoserine dehydrogenase [Cyanobacteria bacterium UBA11371]HBE17646.1 homoserine dehydrogenase [Cyanobacteria bacterium UBA11367]HBE35619.1 homoserine dehydrogenase [Cyanobacteria bacterium UBA11368]HBE48995.1 homoserine dehydrogenase [Cyanobacteria bacterium UBA11369]